MTAFVNWRRVVEATEALCECGGAGPYDSDRCSVCEAYYRLKKHALVFRGSGSTWTEPAKEGDLST